MRSRVERLGQKPGQPLRNWPNRCRIPEFFQATLGFNELAACGILFFLLLICAYLEISTLT